MEELEINIFKRYEWFQNNGFKVSPGKFYFLLSLFVDRPIKIMRSTKKASKKEVLLGVRNDIDVTFIEHIMSIYSKANQKLHALRRVF